jgi:predicted RecA/RadA family phage recombinase
MAPVTRSLIAVVCLAMLAAGCGGGPTGPSSRSGATIAGTVQVMGGAPLAPKASAASALTASIVGTSLSAAVESSGYFQIPGAPSGTIQLLFRDAVVNATVQISNVGSDQLVEIVVQVSGTSATVVSEERTKSKVTMCHRTESGETGSYRSISVSQSAEPAHRAHGDAKVGEPVPGSPGKVFGGSCSVQ